jgi:hypothetical protein
MKPTSLKQAMANDMYVVESMYSGQTLCRVDFRPRFPRTDLKPVGFWVTNRYMQRTYPKTFSRHAS